MARSPSVRVVMNQGVLERLLYFRDGPVARHLNSLGDRAVFVARRLAPVSEDGSHGRPAGYLRDQIHHELTSEGRNLAVNIYSPATTPEGFPYGYAMEVGTGPHTIRSHGDYPLRNPQTGQVFGREVHHPGTAARPHLRPALMTVRYG
jgi:hypothetical protein